MTEPQYRVIADNDTTPDLVSTHAAPGDRLVYDVIDADRWSLVRIERPVEGEASSVQPPTREQIAEALYRAKYSASSLTLPEESIMERSRIFAEADAVLALFPQPTPSLRLDVAEQTEVTRSIDEEFMQEGGTTRHWVQALNRAGYLIAPATQPTPSAEPMRTAQGDDPERLIEFAERILGVPLEPWQMRLCRRVFGGNVGRSTGHPDAEPPSIAEMTPGTTCDANGCNARPRWISAGGFHWCDEHKPFPSRPLDPSTIRNVTLPKGDARA